jgi:hypothetical protein
MMTTNNEDQIREALNAHWRASAAGDASLQASMSGKFSEKAISGSRNTPSPTRGDRHTQ